MKNRPNYLRVIQVGQIFKRQGNFYRLLNKDRNDYLCQDIITNEKVYIHKDEIVGFV